MQHRNQRMSWSGRTLFALVLGLALGSSSCRSIRGTFMSIKNSNMLGEASPGLLDGTRVEPVDLEAAEGPPGERWSLMTFFLPT